MCHLSKWSRAEQGGQRQRQRQGRGGARGKSISLCSIYIEQSDKHRQGDGETGRQRDGETQRQTERRVVELGLSLVLCVFCAAVIKTEGGTQQGVSDGMVDRGGERRGYYH